jgi:DNA-binding transcriptional LysR family regulator
MRSRPATRRSASGPQKEKCQSAWLRTISSHGPIPGSDDRRVDAAADGYDAVVRHGPIGDSRLVTWTLAPSRRVLVASPDYIGRHGAPKSIAELDRHRGVFYTNRGSSDWRFTGLDGAAIVRARISLRVNNGDMMRDAAIAGLGLALLPMFIVGRSDQGWRTDRY